MKSKKWQKKFRLFSKSPLSCKSCLKKIWGVWIFSSVFTSRSNRLPACFYLRETKEENDSQKKNDAAYYNIWSPCGSSEFLWGKGVISMEWTFENHRSVAVSGFLLGIFPTFLLDVRRNSICSKTDIDNLWYSNKQSVCTRYPSLSVISPNCTAKKLFIQFWVFVSSTNVS